MNVHMRNGSRSLWCPGWGSNPHAPLGTADFKSAAYAIPPPGLCYERNEKVSTMGTVPKSQGGAKFVRDPMRSPGG
jgi:hypothetical protein